MTIPELCRQYGLERHALHNRVNRGMSLEDALTAALANREKRRSGFAPDVTIVASLLQRWQR